jgi:hypothetical protein
MLDQAEWYRDSAGNWWQLAEMGKHLREASAKRLLQFALPMARNVFKDLYAYGMPSGEQAQMDLERGEAEVEVILQSVASAQEWMRQTPLYEALTGVTTPVVPEGELWPETATEGSLGGGDDQVLVYVGVSNTDGKLDMEMWQRFHKDVNACLSREADCAATLRWFSPPTEIRLSALFAAQVLKERVEVLRAELDGIRKMYHQDEIAFALATEDFIR